MAIVSTLEVARFTAVWHDERMSAALFGRLTYTRTGTAIAGDSDRLKGRLRRQVEAELHTGVADHPMIARPIDGGLSNTERRSE